MSDEKNSQDASVISGLNVFRELRGEERAAGMKDTIDSGGIGSAMTALSMDFVFGKVWARDGLEPRMRSLVTIGFLIALRQTEELKNHIRIGLTNGLSVREIEEATIQAAAYTGFPAARGATIALAEVVAEMSNSDRPEVSR